MAHTFTNQIQDWEYQALCTDALSPDQLITSYVEYRVDIAVKQIVELYTERALNEGVNIPSTRQAIVQDALNRGWVQTVEQIQQLQETPEDTTVE
ncbi:hypothetical protein CRP403_gp36 [Roseobacter phage CRP-403]|uniref:Uncharacterized protein n=1 Tax=Roseobacter phage CRP-403 TaxID=3072849 RepID=A0AAX3ZY96_9CAUD|nr:hypothetical protein CRP403_gp36 [Roseobacter phage CRP-403]